MNQLTLQQKKFINEYIKTLDIEFALKEAGYKVKNYKLLADKLLSNEFIVKEIKSQIKKQIDSLHVNKGYIIQKLLQIAEFSLEVEDILDRDGNYTGKKKFRDSSAGIKALEGLCKYLGFANSKDKDEYNDAKIITIENLDDEKI